MAAAVLDLRPFGIAHKLKPDTGISAIFATDIQSVFASSKIFRIGTVSYEIIKELGRGTNGITYQCRAPSGIFVAVKKILNVNTYLMTRNFITEAIMQLIIQLESADQPNGPFVPKMYSIGYDAVRKEGYIVSELMRNTLRTLIDANATADNDEIVPNAIQQVAGMLKFLGTRLQFNHRDLKGDNVMYIRNDLGQPIFKLIDMGFSCLTWKGLKINGSSYYGASTCFKKDRDLAQLMLYLHNHTPNLSARLRDHLRALLKANVSGDHVCNVTAGCPANGLTDWASSYKFINRANVVFERTTPNEARAAMNEFLHPPVIPVQSVIPTPAGPIAKRVCPADKVYNPTTGRCVKRTGALGRKILKQQGDQA